MEENFGARNKLSNFEILEPLGRGAHSFVYKARSKSSNRIVAIKLLDAHTKAKREAADEEARFHSLLDGQPFVQLVEEFSDEANRYLVLEYCEKGELFTYMRQRQRLPEEEVLKMLVTILDGLDQLDKRGIAHRDIKLGNIFLTE